MPCANHWPTPPSLIKQQTNTLNPKKKKTKTITSRLPPQKIISWLPAGTLVTSCTWLAADVDQGSRLYYVSVASPPQRFQQWFDRWLCCDFIIIIQRGAIWDYSCKDGSMLTQRCERSAMNCIHMYKKSLQFLVYRCFIIYHDSLLHVSYSVCTVVVRLGGVYASVYVRSVHNTINVLYFIYFC